MTSSQINYARSLIEKTNPLRELSLRKVFPFLCCCLKEKVPFKDALKLSLRKELHIDPSKNEMVEGKNPYLQLGYGINAYFTINKQLFFMMAFISIFFAPIAVIFGGHTALVDKPNFFIDRFSLGNMGGSSTFCD